MSLTEIDKPLAEGEPAAAQKAATTLPAHLSCDVAIVGSGPVGMILSTLLAQRGLKVVVTERWPQRYNLPRAGHCDGETMRTFQGMGISKAVELIARPMLRWDLVTADMELLARVKLGEAGAGWKESYLLYQPELETIVEARYRELGVRVFMGATAIRLQQDADHAQLTIRATDNPDAAPCTIEASLLIGADGAGSFVRSAMGVERRDLGFKANDELVIDFEHNDPDRDLPQLAEVYQVLDINRPRLAGRWSGRRWSRFEFQAREEESRDFLESEETSWKLLSEWGIHPADGKIVRHSIYTFESTLAERWRDGRALLVGDSAHTMPPFMGQGLCSGIRDSLNLAWKIDAVLRGDADLALLDTYQTERLPHVRGVIEMSIAVGNMVLMTDPEQARKRDDMLRSGKVPPAPVFPRLGDGIVRRADSADAHPTDGKPAIQARVASGDRIERFDEFLKPGWKIISRHPVSDSLFDSRQQGAMSALEIQTAHVSRGAGSQFIDIDGEYDLLYRDTGRRAFLLRPDNYVFGSVRTVEELPMLLDELIASLSEHGWRRGLGQKADSESGMKSDINDAG